MAARLTGSTSSKAETHAGGLLRTRAAERLLFASCWCMQFVGAGQRWGLIQASMAPGKTVRVWELVARVVYSTSGVEPSCMSVFRAYGRVKESTGTPQQLGVSGAAHSAMRADTGGLIYISPTATQSVVGLDIETTPLAQFAGRPISSQSRYYESRKHFESPLLLAPGEGLLLESTTGWSNGTAVVECRWSESPWPSN